MKSLIVGDSLSNSREQLKPLGFSPKIPRSYRLPCGEAASTAVAIGDLIGAGISGWGPSMTETVPWGWEFEVGYQWLFIVGISQGALGAALAVARS